jgi:glycosyltransferase involved in cell wall biosynthesis
MADVSIIIPTYNRCQLLPQAIESCLRETVTGKIAIEIIVIDDCSTDRTREVLQYYSESVKAVFLVRNSGAANARNEGLKWAMGRYVKFLDSDDILEAGILPQETCLADHVNADIVVSGWGVVSIDDAGNRIVGSEKIYPAPDMFPLPDAVLMGSAPSASAALYKREYIDGLHWDPNISAPDDWDWFVRAALRNGKIVALNAVSFWWRQHTGSRITSSSSMLAYAYNHHKILNKMEDILEERGDLTAGRKKRLAQYYYKQLSVLSLYDRKAFDKAVDHIYSLNSDFAPVDEEPRHYMRVLGRFLGIRRSILLRSFIKKLVRGKDS